MTPLSLRRLEQRRWRQSRATQVTAFRIDPASRALHQHGQPISVLRGRHPRTFAIDPSGRILVVANMQQVFLRDKEDMRLLPGHATSIPRGEQWEAGFCEEIRSGYERRKKLVLDGMVGLP